MMPNVSIARPVAGPVEPARPSAAGEILQERWPALAAALDVHSRRVSEAFCREAYDCVVSGLIRAEDRKQLARRAEEMGIKAFDAQLLIACAIRQWALDHVYEPVPDRHAPPLTYEYQAWERGWKRFALVIATVVTVDWVILWNWLR